MSNSVDHSVRFAPWTPSRPDPRFRGVRLLLLGESHYEEAEYGVTDASVDLSGLTTEIVQRYGIDGEPQRFFGNLHKMLLGDDFSDSDRRRLWGDVYFYNYVQAVVSSGGGMRPTGSQFKASIAAFRNVLEEIRPEAILVLGSTLWNWMSLEHGRIEGACGLGTICTYALSGGRTAYAAHTRHPSSRGFKASHWRAGVLDFLSIVDRIAALSR